MFIIRTPFRISFFGGGTDFEEYYSQYGGSVLSTTINKYSFVTFRNFPSIFEYKNQLTYSKIERFNTPDEVMHPLVREALKYVPVERIQISYDADLPAGSGIGSSSAFAVGLLQGLHAMRNEFPDKMTLAKEAIYLERVLCNEAGGVQDQLAAAIGGMNKYVLTDKGFEVCPLNISTNSKQELNENLLLVFTGFTRISSEISEIQKSRIAISLADLDSMKQIVDEGCSLLENDSFHDFGRLLNETWKLKKTLSPKISNSFIDEIYQKALDNGAIGGKILGAGSGGFMLLYAEKDKHEFIKKALSEFTFVPFAFDDTGTMILHNTDK